VRRRFQQQFIGMIITIDGPAGTGKSTVAHAVSQQLGFDFLDTGAMYRAAALAALGRGADLHNPAAIVAAVRDIDIQFDFSRHPPTLLLAGQPVTDRLRTPDIDRAASIVAAIGPVRAILVSLQRKISRQRPNLVSEGRDQGSVVFPDAAARFYLDASPIARARRRADQLRAAGQSVNEQSILDDILARDQRDSTRAVAPLVQPAGAIRVDSTDLTFNQVVDRIVALSRPLLQQQPPPV
jgi:cytidylate kinase